MRIHIYRSQRMNELIQSFFTLTMKIAEVKIVQVQRPSNSDSNKNPSPSHHKQVRFKV